MKTISLTQGKVALVDDNDFDRINAHKWQAVRGGRRWYAIRSSPKDSNGKRKTIQMHRAVLDASPGVQVDHINHDSLLNIRENLRICTNTQNQYNRRKRLNGSSQFKGVIHRKYPWGSRWRALIRVSGQLKHLGTCATEAAAAEMYDAAARRFFGPFAALNFPMSGESPAI